MKVVILCGGYGTRIREVNETIPKPMIPIGRYPILWHIMKTYAVHGHQDFILCLGYKGQVIKDFFLNYEAMTTDFTITLGDRSGVDFHTEHGEVNWRVTLAETGLDAMTGARLWRVRKYLDSNEPFMLTYGDGVSDVDVEQLIAFHKSHGKAVTVTGVRPPGRYGELASEAGLVTEFNEKPQATGGRISGGYFVMSPKVFEYLEDREDLILEKEPMDRLVREGELMIYEHDGFWQAMDTSREYKLLNRLYESDSPPWVKW